MAKIFISYRRSDTGNEAGRLRTSLVQHFGRERIFRDKDNISPGVKWRDEVRQALRGDTIVLALIGKAWLTETDDKGQRIIESSESNNRLELEMALRENLRIIPILVEGAQVPKPNELPDDLRELLGRNAVRLRDDDWDTDVRKIIEAVEPRRWSAGASVRVAAVVALLALVSIGTYVATRPKPAPPPPKGQTSPPPVTLNPTAPNFQIVLDRSEAMKGPFGEGTKLDGAKSAVKKAMELVADTDNVAYREFGGECEEGSKSTQLLIPFAPGKTLLEQKLNALATTSGRSTVVSAVVAATGNFDDARFKESRLNKIILITGDYRDCESDPAARIRERLKIYPEVKVDLHFIGAGLTPGGESGLRSLARDTGIRATVHNVRSPAEMDNALRDVLLVERKVDEVREAVVILNQGIDHLRGLVEAIGKKDYAPADQQLALAVGTLARTVVPKPESGQPEDVRELLELAQEERNDQQRMLDAARDLIAASKSGNTEGERKARSAFNTASVAYAERLKPIEKLQQKLTR